MTALPPTTARDDYPRISRAESDAASSRFAAPWRREFTAALDEIDRLRQWKAEAIIVIDGWEALWRYLGRPGRLGQSKSEACIEELTQWVKPMDGA